MLYSQISWKRLRGEKYNLEVEYVSHPPACSLLRLSMLKLFYNVIRSTCQEYEKNRENTKNMNEKGQVKEPDGNNETILIQSVEIDPSNDFD